MPKQTFNELELYVIQNWTDARLLERTLNSIRETYKVVLGKVLVEVRKKHQELDHDSLVLDIDEEDDDAKSPCAIQLHSMVIKWAT